MSAEVATKPVALAQWQVNLGAWFELSAEQRAELTDPDLRARFGEDPDRDELPSLDEVARWMAADRTIRRSRRYRDGGKIMAFAFYQRFGVLLGPTRDATRSRATSLCEWGESLLEGDGLVPSKVERAAKIEAILAAAEDLAIDGGEAARLLGSPKGMTDAALALVSVAKEHAQLGGNYAPVKTSAQIELDSRSTVTYEPSPQAVHLGELATLARQTLGAPAAPALGAAEEPVDAEVLDEKTAAVLGVL